MEFKTTRARLPEIKAAECEKLAVYMESHGKKAGHLKKLGKNRN